MATSSMKLLTLPAVVGIVLVQFNAAAHHSGVALYNRESPVTITGTIARYEWANPHVYLYVEEETGRGKGGDRVTVNGLAGRNAARKIVLLQTLTQPDDTVLNAQMLRLMGSLPQADAGVPPSAASSLDGIWTTLLEVAALRPFMGRPQFALTEKGQAAVTSHVEGVDSTVANCIP